MGLHNIYYKSMQYYLQASLIWFLTQLYTYYLKLPLLNMVWMFVSLQNSCWNPKAQCDRINALVKENPQSSLALSNMSGYNEKSPAPKRVLTQPCWHPDIRLWKINSVVYKLPSLWHFVTGAQTKIPFFKNFNNSLRKFCQHIQISTNCCTV